MQKKKNVTETWEKKTVHIEHYMTQCQEAINKILPPLLIQSIFNFSLETLNWYFILNVTFKEKNNNSSFIPRRISKILWLTGIVNVVTDVYVPVRESTQLHVLQRK